MCESPIRSVLHVTLLASRKLMWGPGFVEYLWTPNLRCCLSVCEVKKLKTILVQTWDRLHILRPCSTMPETPCCSHLLPAMANISSFTKYEIMDMSNSCCHYNYHEAVKRNPVDDASELAFPSCLQFHLENVGLQKRSLPAKVIMTNTPVNNIARKLEKNAWKNTGGGSATDCGRCGGSPLVGFLMASVWWQEIWQTITVKMSKQLVTILQLHNL